MRGFWNKEIPCWIWSAVFLLALWPTAEAKAHPSAPVNLVDVLVLYTPSAKNGAGGTTAMLAQVDSAIVEANTVFQNSRAHLRLRLAHADEIAYDESTSLSTDLARLCAPEDGFLDSVATLRNQYAADLVCLITETGQDFAFYGAPGPSQANAFCVVRQSFLTGFYYFPVALGFNFGCQLERGHADNPGAFPYAYGYSFTTNGTQVSTVEAFTGERLPWFSNPNILIDGVRAGIQPGLPGAADNTAVLNATAPIIAAFRPSAPVTLPPTITLSCQPNTGLTDDSTLVLTATASDPDGSVAKVEFYSGARLLASINKKPYAFTWRKPSPDVHILTAIATDDQGATTHSDPLLITVAPVNDLFANRALLSGSNVVVLTSNRLATEEADDPTVGNRFRHTLWWSWTALESVTVQIDTIGSSFDTILGFFTGTELTNLNLIAITDQGSQRPVLLRATAGVTYHILVGDRGIPGDVILRLALPLMPLNDDFHSSTVVSGTNFATSANNRFATTEPGEPRHAGTGSGHSLWWSWTALTNAYVKMNTTGSSCNTALAVYTGSKVKELTRIAENSYWAESPVQFIAKAGVTYQVAVDGWSDEVGNVFLNVASAPSVLADDLSDAVLLEGNNIKLPTSNYGASREAGEPNHANNPGGRSVWCSWLAPTNTFVQISTSGSEISTTLAVYAGNSMTDLLLVTANAKWENSSVEFFAETGKLYHIAIDGWNGGEGLLVLNLIGTPDLGNDDFTDSMEVSGTNITSIGSNYGATHEPDEPSHAGNPNGRSVWWNWTAPQNGQVRMNNYGSSIPTVLEVFAGSSLSNLVLIASNIGGWASAVEFHATKGVSYHIATEGLNGSQGRVCLYLETLTGPENDDFANGLGMSGDNFMIEVSNLGATREMGEPTHAGDPSGPSVWWSWRAPRSTAVGITTSGSSINNALAVYTGSTVSNLTLLAANANWAASAVQFHAQEGGLYHIVVSGWGGAVGQIRLNLGMAPLNDNFAGRAMISGSNFVVGVSNQLASSESGEPNHAGNAAGHSLWWTWTPTSDGVVEIGTMGSSISTALGVYTGTTLTNLTLVASNAPWNVSLTTFKAVANTPYSIALDGWGNQLGRIQLNLSASPAPINDDFANATHLSGTNLIIHASNSFATSELGEPSHVGNHARRSLWWSWIALGDEVVELSTVGGNTSLALAVYTGSELSNLSPITSSVTGFNAISFRASAGVQYHIAADAWYGEPGSFIISLAVSSAPDNDDFENALVVTGTNVAVYQSNRFATRETGEPAHGGNAGGHSLWWSWTPTQMGIVKIDTGGNLNSGLGVYTGSTVSGLSKVALNADWTAESVRFRAESGATYYIALDSSIREGEAIGFNLLELPLLTNDDFAGGAELTGSNVSIRASNVLATKEPREAWHAGNPGGHSLWWSWTPGQAGSAEITTIGSTINTALGVYVGTSLDALTPFVSNGNWTASSVRFSADAGVTYHIAVDGWSGEVGEIALNLLQAPQIANDVFAGRMSLAVTNLAIRMSNQWGSKELGEPNHAGNPGGHSLWWSWIAPYTMGVEFNTIGSSCNTALAIYTGNSLATLSPVASNANYTSSAVTFLALGGTQYQIAVDGWSGEIGEVTLNLVELPPIVNDNFVGRIQLADTNLSTRLSNRYATKESAEPNHVGNAGGHSLWWSWIAPYTMGVEFNTIGSSCNTALAIYTGNSFSTLSTVASNGNYTASAVAFLARGGTEYQIAVDGWGEEVGDVNLNFLLAMPNDGFGNRTVLSGRNASATTSNQAAAREPNEPDHVGNSGGHSLWWTWIAPTDMGVEMNTLGSTCDTALAVYTGSSLADLSVIASNSNYKASAVWFRASAGTEYQIAVDGWSGAIGSLTLNLLESARNDNFAQRATLLGTAASGSGNNHAASFEPGEPNHAGHAGGHSLWWTWMSPINSTVLLNTSGSTCDTAFAVYTGDTLQELLSVQLNTNSLSGAITFEADANVAYQLAADGWDGQVGLVSLHLENRAPNDDFTNSLVINDTTFTVRSSNRLASRESGEPDHAGYLGGHSLWWSWVANTNSYVLMNTIGSGCNTSLAAYTGSSVDNLSGIASNAYGPDSAIQFAARAGVTYHFAIDGWRSEVGMLALNFVATPSVLEDNFADALTVEGTNFTLRASNYAMSRELGEPNHAGHAGGHSLWINWLASEDAVVRISTSGSLINTVLAVYTGPALTNLKTMAFNANWGDSAVQFTARRGAVLHIAVDGWEGSQGPVVLNLASRLTSENDPLPPENDDFAASTEVFGSDFTIVTSNVGATREPGEPIHAGNPNDPSVWWRWTPLRDGTVKINTIGSSIDTALAVYTGPTVTNLKLIAENANWSASAVQFEAVGGTTYHVAVDGWAGRAGALTWNLSAMLAPANDTFVDRILLTGKTASFTASNDRASQEPTEGLPGGATGRTLWWEWVAPSEGLVSVSISNRFNVNILEAIANWHSGPLVTVYTGSGLSTLTMIASNSVHNCSSSNACEWLGRSTVNFRASKGQTYVLSVDGLNGAMGLASLEMSLDDVPPRPVNDDFRDRIRTTGPSFYITGNTVASTRELGEPSHSTVPDSGSLWWSWTSAATGTVEIRAYPGIQVALYAGNELSQLIPIASGSWNVAFYARAGMVYSIAVADSPMASGAFALFINGPPTPPSLEAPRTPPLPNQPFELHVLGTAGQAFGIEASTDLVRWDHLGFDSVSSAGFGFVDREAKQYPLRFYRVLPLEALLNTKPLEIIETRTSSNGDVIVRIGGPAGQPFYLQTSTDSRNWSDLTNGVLVNGEFEFLDVDESQFPPRVYRVIAP